MASPHDQQPLVAYEKNGVAYRADGTPIAPWASGGSLLKQRAKSAVVVTVGVQIILWSVFILEALRIINPQQFALQPRDLSAWYTIFTAPFLHLSLAHIVGNAGIAIVACFLIGLGGYKVFAESTAVIFLVSGVLSWLFLFNPAAGASGVIYGWITYLVVRGFVNKSVWQIILGVILAFSYASLIFGFIPQAGISWDGHLWGAVSGVVAAMVVRSDDPVKKNKQQQLPAAPSYPQL